MKTLGEQLKLIWNGLTATMGRILGDKIILVAIIALAVQIVTALAPETSIQAERLGELGTTVILALLGVGVKDIVTTWANRPASLEAILKAIQEQLAKQQTEGTPG